jgi:hypothetical protein
MSDDMGYRQDEIHREISAQGKVIHEAAEAIQLTARKVAQAKQSLAALEVEMSGLQLEFQLALQRDTALRFKLNG